MAKAATDEQVQLRRRARRRLIGALALVILIAVVLPWVLESEPRPGDHDVSIQIPSSESGTFTSRVVPGKPREPLKAAAEASKPPPAEAVAGAASDDPLKAEQDKVLAPALPKSVAETGKSQPTKDAKSTPTEAKKRAPERREPAAEGKQFVVQVTALTDAEKASTMQKELAARGFKSYTEVVKSASGDVTRVRVGPYANRESAEQERAKLTALGFDGNVAPR